MLTVLTWVSIVTGGILIILLLLSIFGSFDLDIDMGPTEVETDAGGLGLVKGILTFVSVSSWVIKIMMTLDHHPGFAIFIGLIAGMMAFVLLNYLLNILLSQQENVNWTYRDALLEKGTVYLKIPGGNKTGIITVNINGARRELKARAEDSGEIHTGTQIHVVDMDGDTAIVKQENN